MSYMNIWLKIFGAICHHRRATADDLVKQFDTSARVRRASSLALLDHVSVIELVREQEYRMYIFGDVIRIVRQIRTCLPIFEIGLAVVPMAGSAETVCETDPGACRKGDSVRALAPLTILALRGSMPSSSTSRAFRARARASASPTAGHCPRPSRCRSIAPVRPKISTLRSTRHDCMTRSWTPELPGSVTS